MFRHSFTNFQKGSKSAKFSINLNLSRLSVALLYKRKTSGGRRSANVLGKFRVIWLASDCRLLLKLGLAYDTWHSGSAEVAEVLNL